jgi:hypothetical protein
MTTDDQVRSAINTTVDQFGVRAIAVTPTVQVPA